MRHYIPRFMETIESQADGWPTFVDDQAKGWATGMAKLVSERASRPTHVWRITTSDFANWMLDSSIHPDIPLCLRGLASIDAREAVAYRAMKAADMIQVWVPRDLED